MFMITKAFDKVKQNNCRQVLPVESNKGGTKKHRQLNILVIRYIKAAPFNQKELTLYESEFFLNLCVFSVMGIETFV